MRYRLPSRLARSTLGRVAVAAVAVTATLTGVAIGQATERAGEPEGVRLIGEQVLPHAMPYRGTTVGGLSGLDYDPATGDWYLISDDRSDRQPARFYTAKLRYDHDSFDAVEFTGTHPLLRADGTPFPPDSADTPDPEAIRHHNGRLYWNSEGDRRVPDDGAPRLIDPFVRAASPTGEYRREFGLPAHLRMSAERTGPRRNLTLEGLALSVDRRSLVASLEGPLYQDGPPPTVNHGAVVRLTFLHRHDGQPYRQLAYPVEPVFAESVPPGRGGDNGVVEILAVDRFRYLVMERAYVPGVGNRVRIYQVGIRGASDVLGDDSLADGGYRPVRKRLLVDLADLPLSKVDNVEGMAWGPRLSTGERSLVLVSDDNFSPHQITQMIALAIR